MVYCPKCQSINVKIIDQNFALRKEEGEPAAKAGPLKKFFVCHTCQWGWNYNPEGDKLYSEYCDSKIGTTLIAETVRRGHPYTPQVLDYPKLLRRLELANKIVAEYKHTLDIDPGEWYDLESDVTK